MPWQHSGSNKGEICQKVPSESPVGWGGLIQCQQHISGPASCLVGCISFNSAGWKKKMKNVRLKVNYLKAPRFQSSSSAQEASRGERVRTENGHVTETRKTNISTLAKDGVNSRIASRAVIQWLLPVLTDLTFEGGQRVGGEGSEMRLQMQSRPHKILDALFGCVTSVSSRPCKQGSWFMVSWLKVPLGLERQRFLLWLLICP